MLEKVYFSCCHFFCKLVFREQISHGFELFQDTLHKIKGVLVDEKKHIRFEDWDAKDVSMPPNDTYTISKQFNCHVFEWWIEYFWPSHRGPVSFSLSHPLRVLYASVSQWRSTGWRYYYATLARCDESSCLQIESHRSVQWCGL